MSASEKGVASREALPFFSATNPVASASGLASTKLPLL